MKIGFYLAKKSDTTSNIDCVCSIRERYKKSTGLVVEVKYWDTKRQMCREVKDYPASHNINKSLSKFSQAVAKVAEQVAAEFIKPTSKDFWSRVNLELTGGQAPQKSQYFVEYFAEYTARRKKRGSISTGKKYHTALQKLMAYERKTKSRLTFRDVNLNFYERFEQYIRAERGYTANYFGTLIRCIKVAYRDARDVDGLHNYHETEKRGFATPSVSAKTVYLTNDELQRIANVEITAESLIASDESYSKMKRPDLQRKVEALNLTRNKFLVGAYTALRVSDFNHLSNIHIADGFFRVTTKKTGAAVVIPIHPTIQKMMQAGFNIAAPISEQKINKHIKEVARLAGITYPVEATKVVNNRAAVDWWPKCDVITTHTARRSAATNMYKAGIPTISIMRITGHTTEKSFMKYIKITNEENAELMARNAYFMEI